LLQNMYGRSLSLYLVKNFFSL